jgi:glycoprotein endo-alpha-1,2-mannosidase
MSKNNSIIPKESRLNDEIHLDKRFTAFVVIILFLLPIVLGLPNLIKSGIRQSDPKVLAFYYTWYGNTTSYDGENPATDDMWLHWDENSHNPPLTLSANHTPALGAFDSANNDTIEQHLNWAQDAGIDALIATWWGKNGYDDYNFRKLLQYAEDNDSNLNFTIYFETVQNRYRNNWTLVAEYLEYVIENYGDHPNFLKMNNRPVIFIYSGFHLDQSNWTRIVEKIHTDGYNPYLILDLGNPNNVNADWLDMFDGLHIYNPAGMYKDGKNVKSEYMNMNYMSRIRNKLSCLTVLPGYNDFAVCDPDGNRNSWFDVPRRNGDLYKECWEMVIDIDPDWVLICTFNEWHEGSEIEKSVEYGMDYLDLTATYTAKFKV